MAVYVRGPPTGRFSLRRNRLAAACVRGWLDDGEPLALRRVRLDRLHDRAVHAVGDLVRELDRDLLKACRLEPRLVLALRERAGDAADVAAPLRPLFCRQAVLGDDVA